MAPLRKSQTGQTELPEAGPFPKANIADRRLLTLTGLHKKKSCSDKLNI